MPPVIPNRVIGRDPQPVLSASDPHRLWNKLNCNRLYLPLACCDTAFCYFLVHLHVQRITDFVQLMIRYHNPPTLLQRIVTPPVHKCFPDVFARGPLLASEKRRQKVIKGGKNAQILTSLLT